MQTYPTVVGLLDYGMFDSNRSKVVAIPLLGVEPTRETITSGTYPGSRALFLHVKRAHVGLLPGIRDLVRDFLLQGARPPSYLTEDEWRALLERVASL
jgi:phosphate transport system substrate-binding protein